MKPLFPVRLRLSVSITYFLHRYYVLGEPR